MEVYRARQKTEKIVQLTDREDFRTAEDARNTFNTR
jgi:hypothetical protein